ncbi:LysE family transporter [Methanobacterium oryzae]|uniref:LysE family transporter n=1 Tax=Methanobacterium oryzae TaxID=69540 RepID=UPI003D1BB3DD
MIEVILFAVTSFGVGLSGALVPGPMLTVTITDSVKKGAKAGPLVILGHFITEFLLMMALLAGLGWIIGSSTASVIIGIFGGIILIYMGFGLLKSENKLSNIQLDKEQKHGSIVAGVITSISNPYFFIWWASVGCAFMYKGLELAGIVGLLGFIIGHWAADFSWYSFISFFSSRGSKIMSDKTYNLVMKICGAFLAILGIYFMLSVMNII